MSVKEASIVAGIIGGAGGAGTSYATNNFGLGFSAFYVKDLNFGFAPLDCVKDKVSEEEIKKLIQKVPESTKITSVKDLGSFTAVKSGCFQIQSFFNKKGGAFTRVAFELAAWKEEASPSEGIVIFSSLFLGEQKKATLVSRVFYLKKDSKTKDKLIAEKGLHFTTEIEDVSDVAALKVLLKEAKKNSGSDFALGTVNRYQWIRNPNDPEFELLKQMKITKDGEVALFFGKDFGGSATSGSKFKTVIDGVYSSKDGWKKPDSTDVQKITTPLFSEYTKGKWTSITEVNKK